MQPIEATVPSGEATEVIEPMVDYTEAPIPSVLEHRPSLHPLLSVACVLIVDFLQVCALVVDTGRDITSDGMMLHEL